MDVVVPLVLLLIALKLEKNPLANIIISRFSHSNFIREFDRQLGSYSGIINSTPRANNCVSSLVTYSLRSLVKSTLMVIIDGRRAHLLCIIRPAYCYNILIIEFQEEYRARAREMHVEMDVTPRRGLYFINEKLYFDPREDVSLDDNEEVCLVDTRASLQ